MTLFLKECEKQIQIEKIHKRRETELLLKKAFSQKYSTAIQETENNENRTSVVDDDSLLNNT